MYFLGDVVVEKRVNGSLYIKIKSSPDIDDAFSIDVGIKNAVLFYRTDDFYVQCYYKDFVFSECTMWYKDSCVSDSDVFVKRLSTEEITELLKYIWSVPELANIINKN